MEGERMKPAAFKAIREMVGASQQDVADALHVESRSVRRWEAGQNAIPMDAANLLILWLHEFRAGVDAALDAAEGIERVQLTYYRNQEQYDRLGRDKGSVGRVNAIARETALILMDTEDVEIDWSYPDDSDNIYHKAR